MRNLKLHQNESIILQNDSVYHYFDDGSCEEGELYLTNLNIIFVEDPEGENKIKKYPLEQIKIFNGQVQAILGRDSDYESPQLHVYFLDGQEAFEFIYSGRKKIREIKEIKEISVWVNSISQILTGAISQDGNIRNVMAIPGTEKVAETVRDTIGVCKDVFSMKEKENRIPENVTVKCIGCRAPISGIKGRTVRCRYCDTNNTL